MLRILFLILVMMSSFAFAQTEEKPQAFKHHEFETATNGYVKMIMDSFYVELNNNPSAQGFIVNYGIAGEIAKRERQLENGMKFRGYDSARITFARGGFRGTIKTEMWIVPAGAENPKPESTAKKVDEFEKAYSGEIKAKLDAFFVELYNNSDSQGYIVNYGSAKAVSARENEIRKYIAFRKYDLSKIKFVKGGVQRTLTTEFWVDSSKSK